MTDRELRDHARKLEAEVERLRAALHDMLTVYDILGHNYRGEYPKGKSVEAPIVDMVDRARAARIEKGAEK